MTAFHPRRQNARDQGADQDRSSMSRQDSHNKSIARRSVQTNYTFDNSGAQAAPRFEALATIFDPGTIRHLEDIGVSKGWRCLEVGAEAITESEIERDLLQLNDADF